MNDVTRSQSTLTATTRKKPMTQRAFHPAIKETGACRLSAEETDIIARALLILENKVLRKLKPGEILSSPERVKQWLILHYGMLDREVFGLIFLDARHRYLGHQQLFHGDVQGASVHPRQVARSVFEYNAAACIALHCHPSQIAEPSTADELITQRLKETLGHLEVRLLDHILGGFCSVTTAVKIHQSLGFRGINREQRIQ